jgi:hypothetical protein
MKIKFSILSITIAIFALSCTVNNSNTPAASTPAIFIKPTQSPTQVFTQTITSNPTLTTPQFILRPEPPYAYKTDPCYVKIDNVSIPKSSELTYDEIAEAIFRKWLDGYILCQPPSLWKIDDYRILGLDVQTAISNITNKPYLLAGVEYSVKPSQDRSFFSSGNGVFNDKTGWIECKYNCYTLIVGETASRLTGGSTMC